MAARPSRKPAEPSETPEKEMGSKKADLKKKTPTNNRSASKPARTAPVMRSTILAPSSETAPKTLEERLTLAEQRLQRQESSFRQAYQDRFDMTWIFHDSALEGVVYTEIELRTALDAPTSPMIDSSLQSICDEIRRHREALQYCRDLATKRRIPVSIDVIKKIYLILHPEEGDLKTVKYRKEIPQHRLYFHEYSAPDRISQKVRQVVDWVNDPETKKGRNAIRIAARAHYDLLRAFPFLKDSGKVSRLFMNFLLMRFGYPPAIMHSAERQRYYEALKGTPMVINALVQESIDNALASIEKLLDEHETRTRSFTG